MPVKIKLSDVIDVDARVKYTFNAKYSKSIMAGFYYKDGSQHPDWDYVLETVAVFETEEVFKQGLKSTGDIKGAANYTADKLYQAFKDTLAQAPIPTLKWWVDEYSQLLK